MKRNEPSKPFQLSHIPSLHPQAPLQPFPPILTPWQTIPLPPQAPQALTILPSLSPVSPHIPQVNYRSRRSDYLLNRRQYFSCEFCPKRYRADGNLQLHKKIKHRVEMEFMDKSRSSRPYSTAAKWGGPTNILESVDPKFKGYQGNFEGNFIIEENFTNSTHPLIALLYQHYNSNKLHLPLNNYESFDSNMNYENWGEHDQINLNIFQLIETRENKGIKKGENSKDVDKGIFNPFPLEKKETRIPVQIHQILLDKLPLSVYEFAFVYLLSASEFVKPKYYAIIYEYMLILIECLNEGGWETGFKYKSSNISIPKESILNDVELIPETFTQNLLAYSETVGIKFNIGDVVYLSKTVCKWADNLGLECYQLLKKNS